MNLDGWRWWCVFSRLRIINYLTFGTGLLSSLRGFLEGETHPTTVNIVTTSSTGWKGLPQELVDEILTYLKDDFPSLVSCSGSCKALLCSTRPLIHRTFCLSTGSSVDKYRSSLLNQAQFDNIRLAEQAQVLKYTTRLIIRLGDDFVPENLRPHLRYFRAMHGVTSLEIYLLDATRFLPAFETHFGHIVPTLRSLSLIGARDPIKGVFHFISRFPLLRDLDLVQFPIARHRPSKSYTPPKIKVPPPLNGTLRFRRTYPSIEIIQSLVNVPGGIHFRSIEMGDAREIPLQTIIDACSNTVESITFWTGYRECSLFCDASYTCTYSPHKWRFYRTSSGVMASKGSGLHWQVECATTSRLTFPEFFRTSCPPSFSTFIVRHTGAVFRVEAIGLVDHPLPTGTQHLLSLEPCQWDAE